MIILQKGWTYRKYFSDSTNTRLFSEQADITNFIWEYLHQHFTSSWNLLIWTRQHESILVHPGKETNVVIMPSIFYTTNDTIKTLKTTVRQCYEDDEVRIQKSLKQRVI